MKRRYATRMLPVFLTAAGLFFLGGGARGADKPEKITTALGNVMVLVPGGEFQMGNPKGNADEKPVHKVTISSFYIDAHLVTQTDYEMVTGENPARWKKERNPVEQVRWTDAVKYLNLRSEAEGFEPCYDLETWECDFEAGGYRLPTEAEWEYAARAGTTTIYFFGSRPDKLSQYAWYKENSGHRPRKVKKKKSNPWGIYDMYGNVWEWCNDFYKADYYAEAPAENPPGPAQGEQRILRGGCWDSNEKQCNSAYRKSDNSGYADVCFGYDIYGFRAVRAKEQ